MTTATNMRRTRTNRRGRAWLTAALVSLLTTAIAPAATAHDISETDPQTGALLMTGCDEVFAFPEVSYQQADKLVPEEYDVAGVDADFNGKLDDQNGDGEPDEASLIVLTRRCDKVTIEDVTNENTVDSYIAIGLVPFEESHQPPHTSFLWPGPDFTRNDKTLISLELYIVQWVTSSKLHAKWLTQDTGLAPKVKVVPELSYSYHPIGGVDGGVDPGFYFSAPAPAPSPFHIQAVVQEPTGTWDDGLNLWSTSEDGTLIIYGEHRLGANQKFGPAEGRIISDDPDSPLGRMFGDVWERPLNLPLNKAFSSGYFSEAQWTKCLRNANNSCTKSNH